MGMRSKKVQPAAGLGELIYAVRLERRMSTQEFAEAIGHASHVSVVRWESGTAAPNVLDLLRIGALATGGTRGVLIEECRLRLANVGLVEVLREVARC